MAKFPRSSGDGVFAVLPLRDIVVFPHMIVPLFVGREKSIKALEDVMGAEKQILLATQMNAADDDPEPERHLRHRHARQRAAAAEAARRHREGAGRGPCARQDRRVHRARRLPRGARRAPRRARGGRGRDRGAGPLGGLRLRKLRKAQQEDFAGSRWRSKPDRRLLQARRHGCLASGDQDPREAGDAGDAVRQGAAREGDGLHGGRDFGAPGGEAHPLARQAPDGEDAARVLPQRADEGDPEGARRRRGRPRRGRRDRGAHQEDQAHQGSAREGRGRAEEAPDDVADVGRGDGGAQLSRLAAVDPVGQELQGQARPGFRPGRARQGPLRAGQGQGPHRRVSRRAVAGRRS